ncbi:uncharacterized protein LOC131952700 [Physella acuta]|uniref:uncharacterized protein LOC131952700 n=1 Tax=Physella acuta TaxID=109671 RepID=UPI0027DE59B4|nr:uncharacterized protein LOC131952700 [Physella acuta]
MIKSRAIVLGSISGLVVLGGVAFALLLYFFANFFDDAIKKEVKSTDFTTKYSTREDSNDEKDWSESFKIIQSFPFWVLGFLYIIPGCLGVIAALVQNKCMYVTSLVFCILSLLVMGALIVVSGLTVVLLLFGAAIFSASCETVGDNKCTCKGPDGQVTSFQETCDTFETIYAFIMSIFIVIILVWVALFAQFIVCCYLTCCAKTVSSGGVILHPTQQPMLATNDSQQYGSPAYGSQPNAPLQEYYPPQTNA